MARKQFAVQTLENGTWVIVSKHKDADMARSEFNMMGSKPRRLVEIGVFGAMTVIATKA